MKVTLFEIKFDSRQGVYEAGKPVTGQVILKLVKPLKLRSLKMFFEGKGKSFWDVHSGKHTTKYRAFETYLTHNICLISAGATDGGSVEVPAGTHVYPFSFTLLDTLPSSFEGRRGYVRYSCKATIDRPWKFDEHVKRAFTVIHHLDLNRYTAALAPVSGRHTENIEGCCCSEGSATVSLELNKTGYVPGEPIVYDIKIENNSSNEINTLQLELRQTVKYTGYSDSLFSSGNPKYHEKHESFSLFHGLVNIPQNKTHEVHQAALVPSLPPSQLEGCQIIDIAYQVHLRVPCGWTTLKLDKGIFIGTIPVREVPIITQPTAPDPNQAIVMPTATAPPSYEEGATDGGSVEVPAGTHVYPFSFTLLDTLPSSFEGRRGYVRYSCKATIDRPWKFDEHVKRAFTVIHHLDLNRYTAALAPVSGRHTENIEGCCCSEGSATVSLELNKTGYVPGEPIVYDIKIENNSSNEINTLQLELRQTVKYTGYSDSLFSSGNPKYHEKHESFSLFHGLVNIPQNKTHEVHQAALVPSLPPSQLEGCQIIDITYQVHLRVPCGWTTLKLDKGIFIGTIPVREVPIITQPTAPDPNQAIVMPTATAPPSYEEALAPPPSYAECVFGRQDITEEGDNEHTDRDAAWAPAYPYYDWSQHSAQSFGGMQPVVARPNPPDYNKI